MDDKAEPLELEHRQRVVVEAVERIVARDGLEAVSMRTAAAEAGYSLGMVQRLFATKDELLRHAMSSVAQRLGERVAEMPARQSSRARLRRFAEILVATDGADDRDALVWLAFVARAAVVPELAAELTGHYVPARESVRALLTTAARRGELAPGRRPAGETSALLALIDGLTIHLLIGLVDHRQAKRILANHVDALFA